MTTTESKREDTRPTLSQVSTVIFADSPSVKNLTHSSLAVLLNSITTVGTSLHT